MTTNEEEYCRTSAISQTRGKKRGRRNKKASTSGKDGSLSTTAGATSAVSKEALKHSLAQGASVACLPLSVASDDKLIVASSSSKPIPSAVPSRLSDDHLPSSLSATGAAPHKKKSSSRPLVNPSNNFASSCFSSLNQTKQTSVTSSSASQTPARTNRTAGAAGEGNDSPSPAPSKTLSLLSPSGFLAFDKFTSSELPSKEPRRAKNSSREMETEAEFDRDLYYYEEHENAEESNSDESTEGSNSDDAGPASLE